MNNALALARLSRISEEVTSFGLSPYRDEPANGSRIPHATTGRCDYHRIVRSHMGGEVATAPRPEFHGIVRSGQLDRSNFRVLIASSRNQPCESPLWS